MMSSPTITWLNAEVMTGRRSMPAPRWLAKLINPLPAWTKANPKNQSTARPLKASCPVVLQSIWVPRGP
jgi:hypothetical protein